MSTFLTDPYQIAASIKNAVKQTPVKLYVNGDLKDPAPQGLKVFGNEGSWVLCGDIQAIDAFIQANQHRISDLVLECDRRNSAIPLRDI